MYQCAQIDEASNQCLHWVQVGFLNLPELSLEQAGQICAAISLVLVLAWGFKKLAHFIK